MPRSKMILMVAVMLTAIVAVVVLQGNWLMNSYAVSREKNESEIRNLLDKAITEQKKTAADSVRLFIKRIIQSPNDFKYLILDWNSGTKIAFTGYTHNSYAVYDASEEDLIAVEKNPYDFLIKKLEILKLDEIYPLYATLIGTNYYPDNSPEKILQRKLSASFNPTRDTVALKKALEQIFAKEGRSFHGNVRYFEDISAVYTRPVKKSPIKNRTPRSSLKSIAVIPGSEGNKSLAVKLDLLEAYTDSLNNQEDSTYAVKPILNDINDILIEKVPTILISVDTPYTVIAKKMTMGIFGSMALMVFITLGVVYMYTTILKQKKLSDIKNDFISNISHELKTPIATAQAAVQGLRFFNIQQDAVKTESYLNTASSEIQRLSLMVDKILNISLFESAAFQLNPTLFNFQSMLLKIADSQQLRKEKPVTIAIQYHAQPEIFADTTHLQNVMLNLIDNAIKYSNSSVHIVIHCRNSRDGIEVSISDDGNGIPVTFHDSVFEKFFRVPNNNGHTVKGYGLGLNYVKTIIEKHRGYITLCKTEVIGTTFLIHLPQ